MDALPDIFGRLPLPLTWREVIDVVLVLVILATIFWLLRGIMTTSLRRGALLAILVVLGLYIIATVFQLILLSWLLSQSVTALILAGLVILHPELRRALERVGRPWQFNRPSGAQLRMTVGRAAKQLSDQKLGALIVLERGQNLQPYVDTGLPLDGQLSSELLGAIFMRGSPMHDGAVVVRGDRIIAAGCVLPIADGAPPNGRVGMRHRAAQGIAERSDAVCIVVSEETGAISFARNGKLQTPLAPDDLGRLLDELEQPSSQHAGMRHEA